MNTESSTMKRVILGVTLAAVAAGLAAAAGCASLATPEAPGSSSPSSSSTVALSQQVKDGAQLYVDYGCIRCHAPNGVGGVPNRLNTGGDSTIPALNNAYRDPSEQFTNAAQITTVMNDGSILSKKPGVINMPAWKGVINSAQAGAIAAYILAGLPNAGASYDANPAKAPDIYSAYACIYCHGQVGQQGAPNPKTADKTVPTLRNPSDTMLTSDLRATLMNGSIPAPGTKGVIFMPAWGQILSQDQVNTMMPYIVDGPKATRLPPPLAGSASGASPAAGSSPAPSASGSP